MLPSQHRSVTPNPLYRTAKQAQPQPSSKPARHHDKPGLWDHSAASASSLGGPSAPSRTSLSQRFCRAIRQGDLASAQRIAARAFELQQHQPHSDASNNVAALRAAAAQRSSCTHPFDVRNVPPVADRTALVKHSHHRKYTLAIHDDSFAAACGESDPSLVIAIKSGADVELVRWLIEMGHEREGPSVDGEGNTILHLATLYDRSDIIYAYSTYTASHVASTLADLIDAETLHERRTALHLACIRGYDDVARQLLDLGAEVDLQDKAGNTALHFASAWGHVSLVQLLIERGCSLAVQNAEGATAVDYAYSHTVKVDLESMGRARFESRKKTRRVPVATVVPAAVRPSLPNPASAQLFDEPAADKHIKSRPFPSFLSRNGSHGGGSRSNTTTPNRMAFADTSTDSTKVIDGWDPEKTFAQPGQDLFPSNRGVFSSPPSQRTASPANFSTPGRPSVDLYSEVYNHSPRTSVQARQIAQSPPSGLFPQSGLELEIRRQLSPNPGLMRRSPSPGAAVASADKLRMQDAAAMSLFRSTTPQPSHVPGRIDTPPVQGAGGRSESPLMLVKPGRSPKIANMGLKGEGPPLLAPVATLPRMDAVVSATRDLSLDHKDAGRRSSSPVTPRPDDRESFS